MSEVQPKKLEGKAIPEKRDELDACLMDVFKAKRFKLQYEYERFAYREVARLNERANNHRCNRSENEFALPTIMYVNPYSYELDSGGNLQQSEIEPARSRELVCFANSLVLNFYLRSKVSTHVSAFSIHGASDSAYHSSPE